MSKIKPTHIGLDLALNIIQALQAETSVKITREFLEIINAILNKSIGLQNADLFRIEDRILTLIPFKCEFLERIFRHKIQNSLDIYLVHILANDNFCYCIPLTTMQALGHASFIKIKCEKITPIEL